MIVQITCAKVGNCQAPIPQKPRVLSIRGFLLFAALRLGWSPREAAHPRRSARSLNPSLSARPSAATGGPSATPGSHHASPPENSTRTLHSNPTSVHKHGPPSCGQGPNRLPLSVLKQSCFYWFLLFLVADFGRFALSPTLVMYPDAMA